MANRYSSTKTFQNTDTKKYYLETTIYPNIDPSDSDLYILTEETDRLDLLAQKYYGNPKMWWVIATTNNLNDANLYVKPGTQLRIPIRIEQIMSNLEKINR